MSIKIKKLLFIIIFIASALLIILGAVNTGYAYFTDKDEISTNVGTTYLNTKINARIDDSITSISSDNFTIKTIDVKQFNNSNVNINSELNITASWKNNSFPNKVYFYPCDMSDYDIKNDVNTNGADLALSKTISNELSYIMPSIEINKYVEQSQQLKVVINGKYDDMLNIVLTSNINQSIGYGYTEKLVAHLFIKCEGGL